VDPQHPELTPFEHRHLTLRAVSGLGDKAWWVPEKSELGVAAGDRGYIVDLLTIQLPDSELEGACVRIVKLVMN
jgi:hypothetical protein